ncbi:sensor histidine kinase [Streptomyces sp. NPDC090127]|uniref:sensor histidine kinase n=1 Tax=Streptomyces sp. NPDC090127 TaxID=3365953 RepID=UPI003818D4FE
MLRADEEGAGEPAAPTAPVGETVEEVVERARASGLRVELTRRGPDGGTPAMADRAVHRLVVESLTNAAEHAPGAPVRVALERTASTVTVAVSSGPAARPAGGEPPARPASGGTGLVGLDERVRLAGGRLTHGARADGGFVVRAVLPLEPGALAPEAVRPPAPTSVRERDRAAREVRRGLAQAVWIPLALVAALGVVMLVFGLWTQSRSFLDRDDYAGLRVGDALSADAERLPPHPLDGPPAGAPPPSRPAWTTACTTGRR